MRTYVYRMRWVITAAAVALALGALLYAAPSFTNPATAELDFFERSQVPGVAGSVVPASCESSVINHFAGDCQCNIQASPCYGEVCIRNITWSTEYAARNTIAGRLAIGIYGGPQLYQGNTSLGSVASRGSRSFTIPATGDRFSIRRPDGVALCAVNVSGLRTLGALSGTGCTIPLGGSSCRGSLTWSTQNVQNPTVVNVTRNNTRLSTRPSGTNVATTLVHGINTIQLRNTFSAETVVLGSADLSAVCAEGSVWNGSRCALACTTPGINYCGQTGTGFIRNDGTCSAVVPEDNACNNDDDLSVTVDPEIVREGNPVTITFDLATNWPENCTLTGTGLPSNPYVFSVGEAAGSFTVEGLEQSTIYTLRCGTAESTFQVQIIPSLFEI